MSNPTGTRRQVFIQALALVGVLGFLLTTGVAIWVNTQNKLLDRSLFEEILYNAQLLTQQGSFDEAVSKLEQLGDGDNQDQKSVIKRRLDRYKSAKSLVGKGDQLSTANSASLVYAIEKYQLALDTLGHSSSYIKGKIQVTTSKLDTLYQHCVEEIESYGDFMVISKDDRYCDALRESFLQGMKLGYRKEEITAKVLSYLEQCPDLQAVTR